MAHSTVTQCIWNFVSASYSGVVSYDGSNNSNGYCAANKRPAHGADGFERRIPCDSDCWPPGVPKTYEWIWM